MGIAIASLALAAATAHAQEYRFEIKNCRSEDLTVRAYFGDDSRRIIPSSGWEDMKQRQTIGFVCDEKGKGYCWVRLSALMVHGVRPQEQRSGGGHRSGSSAS